MKVNLKSICKIKQQSSTLNVEFFAMDVLGHVSRTKFAQVRELPSSSNPTVVRFKSIAIACKKNEVLSYFLREDGLALGVDNRQYQISGNTKEFRTKKCAPNG
jgi:hypothetical protein